MAKHGCGRLKVDTYLLIPQRFVSCRCCGTIYNGPKSEVICEGCGLVLITQDVNCEKRIPTGQWLISNQRARPNDRKKRDT